MKRILIGVVALAVIGFAVIGIARAGTTTCYPKGGNPFTCGPTPQYYCCKNDTACCH